MQFKYGGDICEVARNADYKSCIFASFAGWNNCCFNLSCPYFCDWNAAFWPQATQSN